MKNSTLTQTPTTEIEQTILRATLHAGTYLRKHAFDYGEITWKKLDDPVTRCDRHAEQLIENYITKNFPANFLGEEYGARKNGADITILMDPIDGTKSFIRGEFLSTVSVAAEREGVLFFGAVYDFMRGILFYANTTGAYMQYHKQLQALPLHATPLFAKPNMSCTDPEQYQHLQEITTRKQIASVALSMAQLAQGSVDGLILNPYQKDGPTDTCDIAAGYYLVKQAGFHVTDFYGRPYHHRTPGNGFIAIKPSCEDVVRTLLQN